MRGSRPCACDIPEKARPSPRPAPVASIAYPGQKNQRFGGALPRDGLAALDLRDGRDRRLDDRYNRFAVQFADQMTGRALHLWEKSDLQAESCQLAFSKAKALDSDEKLLSNGGGHEMFGEAERKSAGADCYVLIRDTTCRLFGYHGVIGERAFSLDHMFGF